MFHPYMTQLLATERRRDYLRPTRACSTSSHLRSPRPKIRLWGIGDHRFRFGLGGPAPAQLGPEFGARPPQQLDGGPTSALTPIHMVG